MDYKSNIYIKKQILKKIMERHKEKCLDKIQLIAQIQTKKLEQFMETHQRRERALLMSRKMIEHELQPLL